MKLGSDAFAPMDHLKLLKFFAPPSLGGWEDNVRLPRNGFQSLSNELRLLHWERFPSKILAPNFCAEHLVEINLSYSKVKRLWTGKQQLPKLKRIDLRCYGCSSRWLLEGQEVSTGFSKPKEAISEQDCNKRNTHRNGVSHTS